MKELTRAEEQIMRILWLIEKGFVKEILERLPDPKPAYNTVSTIVRILEKKGFVSYEAFGKTHQYYPIVSQSEYTKTYLGNFVRNYFQDSYSDLVSFFTQDKNLTVTELEEILQMIQKQIENQQAGEDE